jgi:aspartate/methionine/tyrosine aminotransferase
LTLKVSRRGAIAPFIAMEVLRMANERAAAGNHVVHLEVGQPSTGAPRAVIEAAKRALDTETLGYTEALGLPVLRRRLAQFYGERHGIAVDPARIVVTTGSSGAFLLAFLAAFDVGDRVAIAAPGYPAHRNILHALGIEPVEIPVDAATRFQLTAALLDRVEGRLDGVIIASPSNPAGSIVPKAELHHLADYCRERAIRVFSDEVYHGIVYGEPPESIASLSDQAVVINSFSKYFSMTGWRLGWMIVPQDLLRPVESLAQNLYIAPPSLPQHAALAVFDCRPELEANVRRYRANRDLLLAELPRAGLDRFAPPDGAFYLFADVGRLTNDSEDFCRRMLAEAGVAATPGTDFDSFNGRRFVRFSFAGATEDMAEAVHRLAAWRAVQS